MPMILPNFFFFLELECISNTSLYVYRIRVQIFHCRIRVHNRLLCSLWVWGWKFFSVLLILEPYFLHCKNVNRYDKKYLFIQKSSLSVVIHKHGKSGGRYIAIALNLRLSINCWGLIVHEHEHELHCQELFEGTALSSQVNS